MEPAERLRVDIDIDIDIYVVSAPDTLELGIVSLAKR